ncbi:MAG: type I-F CRISPR-associated helicase Cas3f [Amphritea sp.]|nr:type I-F CRISPR-associated helicase Cas3f [Amphritea sp.]
MMVTFVSQCEKNALKKTRRVLDAFANRIGDNTWQTIITQEGLNAVRKLLRKTASKSTAVSCHWIRSRARSEFLWVVGRKDKFNAEGVVPVNRTRNNRYDLHEENNWHYLPLIQALAAVAALMHDWGKASDLFQEKLKPESPHRFKGDPIRHEWISCLLFSAFVRQGEALTDADWLSRLANGEIDEQALSVSLSQQAERSPFLDMPMLAQWILWLIVSHHRLPNLSVSKDQKSRLASANLLDPETYKEQAMPDMASILNRLAKEWGYENRYDEAEYQQRLRFCFRFSKGLLGQSRRWRAEVKRWAGKLADQAEKVTVSLGDSESRDQGCCRVILQHARLCLMLGDHYYSSQDKNPRWPDATGLYANTDRKLSELKQKLDEHLCGVTKAAVRNVYQLPVFEHGLGCASGVQALRKRSPKAFQWQDKAAASIKDWRSGQPKEPFGFFAVNMASTGTGKTFANAKVMRALSTDGDSLRYTLALGLRTLTLQTGDEYRERIGLDRSQLAVLIGSRAVMELHHGVIDTPAKATLADEGSESKQSLLDEFLDFESALDEDVLTTVLSEEKQRQFLHAPVLSCTIDHLMSATDCTRGGRYILPSLRMMSADLVIDEVDDFSGDDLIAIGRLVFFVGMMGRKVMISSATIPPDLAEGFFKAYRDGWNQYARFKQIKPLVGCAWIDEFTTRVKANQDAELGAAITAYRDIHRAFIDKRITELAKQTVKRKAGIVDCTSMLSLAEASRKDAYFTEMANQAFQLHQDHHSIDSNTGLQVSFGVIRMANIRPCVALSRYLMEQCDCPSDTEIRVMSYHSQQVLYLRSEQEKHLDAVLKRHEARGEAPQAFANRVIRQHLDAVAQASPKVRNLLFMLVATPVEEVGRDHDFDWAVIEPSSYRAIIQLAGRVRRHRMETVEKPNIAIMSHNLKGLHQAAEKQQKHTWYKRKPVFEKPGFESASLMLASQDVRELLDQQCISQRLDATPRIGKPAEWHSGYFRSLCDTENGTINTLAGLEHVSIWKAVANYSTVNAPKQIGPAAFQGYLNECWWLTGLPQTFVRFRKSDPTLSVYLNYRSEQEEYRFCEINDDGEVIDRERPLGIIKYELDDLGRKRLWLKRDHIQAFGQLAEQQQKSRFAVSLRFGELSFRYKAGKSYRYNDQLGLVED